MAYDTSHSTVLRRSSLLRVRARSGGSVTCVRGMVWLTQENDPMDRVLSAGEQFQFDRPGIALVNALGRDAALTFSRGIAWEHAHPSARTSAPASVGDEIGRVCTRFDPHLLRALPPDARIEAVEREARRMRAQVLWLVFQRIRRALVETVVKVGGFGRKALSQVEPQIARKGRRVRAQQGF
jgi:hypothetical protein